MKTFEEHIQDAVGARYPIDIILSNLETDDIVEEVNNYAKDVAREALNNASENAKTVTDSFPSEGSGSGHVNTFHSTVVDKQSILNESNIPII